MPKKIILFLICNFCLVILSFSQKTSRQAEIDTSFTDYDALFNDLNSFLDSLTVPRSFIIANVGFSTGYYNFSTKESYVAEPIEKVLISPSISYFSKTGLGIGGSVSVVHDGQKLNPYQFAITVSYDYLKNRKFLTGISLTRFFTKSNVPFYTSPLQNGAFAYFTYRDLIIKPTISVNYGWGTRSAYTERKELINAIRLKKRGYTRVNTLESINDLTITASIRHDFYWLNVFSEKEYMRLTPQVSFISGTQKFGINQTANTYATIVRTGTNVLYSSENVYLDDQLDFQPLSLTMYVRGEYSIGKFFIQPQLAFDYYFPTTQGNFSTLFSLNMGMIF